ncbi:hypothetical protein FQR65_LT19467 [Abscondita terminalis]|nr:hypothetical protein FQR65_LT19467 [Abscondita terminalis]
MKTVHVLIEKNDDGFWAHSTNVDSVNGYGETVEECKQNIFEGIEVAKELDGRNKFPYKDGDYEGLKTPDWYQSKSRCTIMLPDLKKPRSEERKKITEGLHKLLKEPSAIEL